MKFLFTGMASSNCKPSSNIGFFNTLATVAESLGTVDWSVPSLSWDKKFFDQYDAVIVGFLPPTSLTANYVYPTLNLINTLYGSPKLNLVLESPQIWQYKNSISACHKNDSNIFTEFYSKRHAYKQLIGDSQAKNNVLLAISKLDSEKWPLTIYPQLPWKKEENIETFFGLNASNFFGLNLDSWLLTDPQSVDEEKINAWHIDNPKTDWSKKIEKLLAFPLHPIKDKRLASDVEILTNISKGIGVLLSPQERGVGTWWSPRYIQAMNQCVPIVSDWQETRELSTQEWNLLASHLESCSGKERFDIAVAQRISYGSAIPGKAESIELVNSIVKKK
jgi:hypothetical protein